jgi:hypothetical protein
VKLFLGSTLEIGANDVSVEKLVLKNPIENHFELTKNDRVFVIVLSSSFSYFQQVPVFLIGSVCDSLFHSRLNFFRSKEADGEKQ